MAGPVVVVAGEAVVALRGTLGLTTKVVAVEVEEAMDPPTGTDPVVEEVEVGETLILPHGQAQAEGAEADTLRRLLRGREAILAAAIQVVARPAVVLPAEVRLTAEGDHLTAVADPRMGIRGMTHCSVTSGSPRKSLFRGSLDLRHLGHGCGRWREPLSPPREGKTPRCFHG